MRAILKKYFFPIACFLIIGYTFFVFTNPRLFGIMLLVSYAYQGVFLFALIAVVALFKRKYIYAFLIAICSILTFGNTAQSFENDISDSNNDLSVMQMNVLAVNENYNHTLDLVLENQPHIVCLQEITSEWLPAIQKKLMNEYPYRKIIPLKNCYGMALFSKYPLNQTIVKNWAGVPNIFSKVDVNDTEITIAAFHVVSPGSPGGFIKRNLHLAYVAEFMRQVKGKSMIIGDLNTVPWDYPMRKMLNTGAFKESRKEWLPTFPNELPGFLKISLDYILHTPNITCTEFKVINNKYSDHDAILGHYDINESQ